MIGEVLTEQGGATTQDATRAHGLRRVAKVRAALAWPRLLRTARARKAANNEVGFTLIELVIVCAIMPIVLGGITVGIIATFSNEVSVSTQTSDSASLQTTSEFFVRDVQSSAQLTTATAPTGSPSLCAAPSNYSLPTALLGLEWSSSSTNTTTVTYWAVRPPSAANNQEYDLVRTLCVNGGSQSQIVVATDLSLNLFDPSAWPATVTCPLCTGSQNPSSNWAPAQDVSGVSLLATTYDSGLPFNLQATPRLWVTASAQAGGTEDPPLTLTGTGSVAACSGGNTCELWLETSGGSVDVSGIAGMDIGLPNFVQLASGTTLSATGVEAENCSGMVGGACPLLINPDGPPGYSGTPTDVSEFPSVSESAPSQPASSGTPGSCSTSGTTETYTPGVFSTSSSCLTMSTAPSETINFEPGNYLFQGELVESGGSNQTIEFGGGDYTLAGGLEDAASGDTIENTPGTGGTFFYNEGPLVLADPTAKINLSAPTEGPYTDVLYYQTGTNQITWDSSSAAVEAFNGSVIAPYAQVVVTLESTTEALDIDSLMAQQLWVIGGGTVDITGVPVA